MRRLLRVAAGLLLGFITACLCLAGGLVVEAAMMPAETGRAIMTVAALLFANAQAGTAGDLLAMTGRGLWSAAVVVGSSPLCLVVVIGEAASVRSLRWPAWATGLVTAAMPGLLRAMNDAPVLRPMSGEEGRLTLLLFLAGVAAGGVYWLVAGVSGDKRQ